MTKDTVPSGVDAAIYGPRCFESESMKSRMFYPRYGRLRTKQGGQALVDYLVLQSSDDRLRIKQGGQAMFGGK
jgi:hypothetical protein